VRTRSAIHEAVDELLITANNLFEPIDVCVHKLCSHRLVCITLVHKLFSHRLLVRIVRLRPYDLRADTTQTPRLMHVCSAIHEAVEELPAVAYIASFTLPYF
jgi:hypothetical protein